MNFTNIIYAFFFLFGFCFIFFIAYKADIKQKEFEIRQKELELESKKR